MANDPVFFDTSDERWYFWTETWMDTEGPYKTETEARYVLELYCRSLESKSTAKAAD